MGDFSSILRLYLVSYIIYTYSSVLRRRLLFILILIWFTILSLLVLFSKYGLLWSIGWDMVLNFVPCFWFAKILLLAWTEKKCLYNERLFPLIDWHIWGLRSMSQWFPCHSSLVLAIFCLKWMWLCGNMGLWKHLNIHNRGPIVNKHELWTMYIEFLL